MWMCLAWSLSCGKAQGEPWGDLGDCSVHFRHFPQEDRDGGGASMGEGPDLEASVPPLMHGCPSAAPKKWPWGQRQCLGFSS